MFIILSVGDSKSAIDTEEPFKTIPGNHSAAVVKKVNDFTSADLAR